MRVLPKRTLTTLMLQTLEDRLGLPVGDGIAPAEGGWERGEPNVGAFVPYVVLKVRSASTASGRSVGNGWTAWDVAFEVASYGASRHQCDWMSDGARAALAEWLFGGKGQDFTDEDGSTWRLHGTRDATMGMTSRVDATDPPYWQATDTYTVSCDRSLKA